MLKKRFLIAALVFIFLITSVGNVFSEYNGIASIGIKEETVTSDVYNVSEETAVSIASQPLMTHSNNDLFIYDSFSHLTSNESAKRIRTSSNNPAWGEPPHQPGLIVTDGSRGLGTITIEEMEKNGITGPLWSVWYNPNLLVNTNRMVVSGGKGTLESTYSIYSHPGFEDSTATMVIDSRFGLNFIKNTSDSVLTATHNNYGDFSVIRDLYLVDGKGPIDPLAQEIWSSFLVNMTATTTLPGFLLSPEKQIGYEGNNAAHDTTGKIEDAAIIVGVTQDTTKWAVGGGDNSKVDYYTGGLNSDIKVGKTQLLVMRSVKNGNDVTTQLFVINNEDDLKNLSDENQKGVNANYTALQVATATKTTTKFNGWEDLRSFTLRVIGGTYYDDVRIGKTLSSVVPQGEGINSVNIKQNGSVLSSLDSIETDKTTDIDIVLANPEEKSLTANLKYTFVYSDGYSKTVDKEETVKSGTDYNEGWAFATFNIPAFKDSEADRGYEYPVRVDYEMRIKDGNEEFGKPVTGSHFTNRVIEMLTLEYKASGSDTYVTVGSNIEASRSSETKDRFGEFRIITKPTNPSADEVVWSADFDGGLLEQKYISSITGGRIETGTIISDAKIGLFRGTQNMVLRLKRPDGIFDSQAKNFTLTVTGVPIDDIILKEILPNGSTGMTYRGVEETEGEKIVLTDLPRTFEIQNVPSDADISTVNFAVTDTNLVKLENISSKQYKLTKLAEGNTTLTVTIDDMVYSFPVSTMSSIKPVTGISFKDEGNGTQEGKFIYYAAQGVTEIDRDIKSFVDIMPLDADNKALKWEVAEKGQKIIELNDGIIKVLDKGEVTIRVTSHNGMTAECVLKTVIPLTGLYPKAIYIEKDSTLKLTSAHLTLRPSNADITGIEYELANPGSHPVTLEQDINGRFTFVTANSGGSVNLNVTVMSPVVVDGKLITKPDADILENVRLEVTVAPTDIVLSAGEGGEVKDNIIYIDKGTDIKIMVDPAHLGTEATKEATMTWKLEEYIDKGNRNINPYNSYINGEKDATSGSITGTQFGITSWSDADISDRQSRGEDANIPVLVLKAGAMEKRFLIIEREQKNNVTSLEYLSRDTQSIATGLLEGTRWLIDQNRFPNYVQDHDRFRTIRYDFHSKEDNVEVEFIFNYLHYESSNGVVSFDLSVTSGNTVTHRFSNQIAPVMTRIEDSLIIKKDSNNKSFTLRKGLNSVEIKYSGNGILAHRGLVADWTLNGKPDLVMKAFNYISNISLDANRLNKDIAQKGIINFEPILMNYLNVTPSNASVVRYRFEADNPNIKIIDSNTGRLRISKAGNYQNQIRVMAETPDGVFSQYAEVGFLVSEAPTVNAEFRTNTNGLAGGLLDSINLINHELKTQAVIMEVDETSTSTNVNFSFKEANATNFIDLKADGRSAVLSLKNAINQEYSFTLTATITGANLTKSIPVKLMPNNLGQVMKIEMTNKELSVSRGETNKLADNIMFFPSTAINKNLIWEQKSGFNNLTLSHNGDIKGLREGYADICAYTDDGGRIATARVYVKPVSLKNILDEEKAGLLTFGLTTLAIRDEYYTKASNREVNVYRTQDFEALKTNFEELKKAYAYEAATHEFYDPSRTRPGVEWIKELVDTNFRSVFEFDVEGQGEPISEAYMTRLEHYINGRYTLSGDRFRTKLPNLGLFDILDNKNNAKADTSFKLGPVDEANYEITGLPAGLTPDNVKLEIVKGTNGNFDLQISILGGITTEPVMEDKTVTITFKPYPKTGVNVSDGEIKAKSVIYPALEADTSFNIKLNAVNTLMPVVTTHSESTVEMTDDYLVSLSKNTFSVDVGLIDASEVKYSYISNEYKQIPVQLPFIKNVPIKQGSLPSGAYIITGLPNGIIVTDAVAANNKVTFKVGGRTIKPVDNDMEVYVKFTPMIVRDETNLTSENITAKAIYNSDSVYAATLKKSKGIINTSIGGSGGGGGGGGGGGSFEKLTNAQADMTIEKINSGVKVYASVKLDKIMNEIASKSDSVIAIDIQEQARGALYSEINTNGDMFMKAFKNNNHVLLNSGAANLALSPNSVQVLGEVRYSVRNDNYTLDISLTDENGEVKINSPVELTIIYDTKEFSDPAKVQVAYYNPTANIWEPLQSTVVSNGLIKANVTSLGRFRVIEKETAAVTDTISDFTAAQPQKGFQDLDNVPWARTSILLLEQAGIINGITETEFAPNDILTRAQFAALILRVLKLNALDILPDFYDVSETDWFYTDVSILASHRIIRGNDGLFRPNDGVSREEMAAIISRALNLKLSVESAAEDFEFTDSAGISQWADLSVKACVEAGLLLGMEDGRFAPFENTTRAQAAVVIHRIYNLRQDQSPDE